MKTLQKAVAAVFAASAMVSGATIAQVIYDSTPRYVQANPAQVGTVESIDVVRNRDSSGNRAAGTILGGGVVGHQFGSGRGNDAATVAGALGGAAVGHELAENRSGHDGYRVNVRLDNGGLRTFYQDDVYGLNVGDRVQIDNDRVVRYAETPYRNDDRAYRSEERSYRSDAGDSRAYPNDSGYRYDPNGYRIAESSPTVRYLPNGRLDHRVYHYDNQGYRVDQWGNRYDAEGYWVDERGNRHEYQDPPMDDDVPGRVNHPQ
jgi:uncharacterized protein YcfJ